MLHFLWGKQQVMVNELERKVCGEEGEAVTDSNLRSTLSKLNARLATIGIPWEYQIRAGYVIQQ